MKLGLISDVHSNLEALQAVLDELERLGAEKIVCLGDVVGYGPDPDECVALVRDRAAWSLLGNHDAMAVGQAMPDYINLHARRAMEWTKRHLSPESADYLRKLPFLKREEGAVFVHSSPRSPADWSYVTTLEDVVEISEFFSEPLCFLAHTHRPMLALRDAAGRFGIVDADRFELGEGERLVVNVGSVGQPRDNDPRATAVLADTGTRRISFVRVPYDVQAVQKKMLERGLPEFLAMRLARGC
ncbi:MAG: metallophosphoesterase family protein [Fibrobacterales bacterium]|nr:metallophosphoesterase family protein [Fibrobacterales bacterium]